MSQTETAKAAADLTASILGEFATKHGDENAARMLSEMAPDQVVEAPASPVSSPTPAAEAAPEPDPMSAEPTVETPEPDVVAADPFADLSPQLSDEYAALLEEPDFDEEAEAEIAAEADENEYDETFDQDAAKKIRALEKRNQWLEQQNVKNSKSRWVQEAERSFPLLKAYAADELREIDATSRRGFAREAAKLNDRYSRVLGPALREVAALKEQAKTEGRAEAREEAKAQWGLPAAEPAGSAAVSEQERQLREARERRAPLVERLKILGGIPPKQ